jgi:MFS family permease
MLTCGLANATDAIEIMSLSYIFPMIEEDMPAWTKGAMSSAVFGGMLLGALVCGGLTDALGRRPVLIATMGMNAVFTLFFAASRGHDSMVVLRFLTGFGCGGSVPVVFAVRRLAYAQDFLQSAG